MRTTVYLMCRHGEQATALYRPQDDIDDRPALSLTFGDMTISVRPQGWPGVVRTMDEATVQFVNELVTAAEQYRDEVERIYKAELDIVNDGDGQEADEAA